MKQFLYVFIASCIMSVCSCKRCVQTDMVAESDGILQDSAGTTFATFTLRQNRINYNLDCAQDTACNNFIVFKNRSGKTITFTYRVQNTTASDPWTFCQTISKLKGNDTTATSPQWTSGKCYDLFAPSVKVSVVSAVKYE